MSRDFTLFQFDVDEATVRRVLSSIPGVTPLPPDGEGAQNDSPDGGPDDGPGTSDDSRTASGADDEASPPADASSKPGDATARAGVEAHLGDSSAVRDPGGPGGGPSTPWPGAPGDDGSGDEDEGMIGGLSGKQIAIAVGLVLGLGVIGVAIVWFVKQRGDDSSEPADDAPLSDSLMDGTDAGEAEADDGDAGSSSAEDGESRSYPIDPSPIVGMAFLAVGTVVVQHFRSAGESDDPVAD